MSRRRPGGHPAQEDPMSASDSSGGPDAQDEFPFAAGAVVYLQVPSDDIGASARFYRAVFGWDTEDDEPSFTAAGLLGQFVLDRSPAPHAGLLAWIYVDSMPDAIKAVRAHGGDVTEEPYPDGPVRWLAEARDPAGNAIGLVTHGPFSN